MKWVASLVCVWPATAQSIPRDEIRSRTISYSPRSPLALRADALLVEVPVVVRDKQNHAVGGLRREDFEIRDDGKKQEISSFSIQTAASRNSGSKESPQPRFLALCFDNLHLDEPRLKPARDAAERFVKTGLSPGDFAAVFTTGQSNNSQFTADVDKLVEQIAKVASAPAALPRDQGMCPRIGPLEAYQLANHMDPGDALLGRKMAECEACFRHPCREGEVMFQANAIWTQTRQTSSNTLSLVGELVSAMTKMPGQRIVLLTSGGFLTGSLETDVDRLVDRARHAGVVISALDTMGLKLNGSTASGDGMAALASGTGGAFYHANNDLDRGFQELGTLPETMYVLGFTPPAEVAAGHFHSLKVRLPAGKNYSVHARLGYTAPSASDATPAPPASRIDAEAMASDEITELPVSFTFEQWTGPPGITLVAHVDIGHLPFKSWQGRRTQRLTLVGLLLDSQGVFVAGKRSEMDLSLRDATFAQLSKTGFTAGLTIAARPGNYSVRAVVQVATENKLSGVSAAAHIN